MKRRLALAFAGFSTLLAVWAFPGCVGDDVVPTSVPDASTDAPVVPVAQAKDNGLTCGAATECKSAFCIDGVCCESACSGTCESCKIPGALGKCAAVPDGQDPDKECPTQPLPDAGAPVVDDAGSADAGDAGEPEGGTGFEVPDGGIETNDTTCAGSCNGSRACAFPGTQKNCGTIFCDGPTSQTRASCDGKGHCLPAAEACVAYACPEDSAGCKTSCTAESDCLPTHYCGQGTCKPKFANGTACTVVTECQSGFCADGVCCNTACEKVPGNGATCVAPSNVGSCRCSACPTGPCQTFYPDADGDGYGDKTATIANARAQLACVGTPPVGFVANNTDCYDEGGPAKLTAAKVHPGQTDYFDVGYGPGLSFDYNCDGQPTKYYAEYPSGTLCGRCAAGIGSFCTKVSSCSAGTSSYHGCGFGICQIGKVCSSCRGVNAAAFHTNTTVACGQPSTLYTCQECAGASVPAAATTPAIKQRCR